jgi:hypothetical protein
MGVQGTALGEEVSLGVEAVGILHARASLRQSKELCPGPAPDRRVPGGYDAQSLEKRQSAAVGARERGAAGRHHFPDSRAQFVGRRSSASSAWLREEGIEEGAEFEEVRDTKRGSCLSRQEIGVGDTQIGPFDGDAEHRPVRELQ